jgi:sulfur-oxidizing protein SoxY
MTPRRDVLIAGLGTMLLLRPASATPDSLRAALAAFTRGAPVREGRITLDIAPLVENGNVVPVSISVSSPMTAAEHVRRIALFTSRNPQPEVLLAHLGPRAGRAVVATRMRLATSQQVLAVAELSDGTFWRQGVDVIVTLAACVEG